MQMLVDEPLQGPLQQQLQQLALTRQRHHQRVLHKLLRQPLLQVLWQQHRLVAFLQERPTQVLILRHHHAHLPHRHVMDMDQLRIPIHLHLQVMQVLRDLLQVHIHHMMSIVKTCANTLTPSQLTASYTQALSRPLSPRSLMVPLTLSMGHLSLMDTVQYLRINMIGSIKVLISRFYQLLQRDSNHPQGLDFQLKLPLFANSPGTVINGMAEPKVFKRL